MCPEHQVGVRTVASSLYSKGYKSLTGLLVAARLNAGLTQQQVVDCLGKPQSFVAKYEGGERRLDVIELIDICNTLGVDPISIVRIVAEQG